MKNFRDIISGMLVLAMMTMATMATAQNNEGRITLEITDVTSDNPQVASMKDMLIGSETIVNFRNNESLTQMNMMGGMVKIDLKVDADQKSDMLMDMMGQKIWVETSKTEADLMKAENQTPFSEMEISYDQNDIKTVAGYQCHKMIIAFPDNPTASLVAYVTNELNINAPVIQGIDMEEFQGFPLEYIFNNGMMSMSITTKSVDTTVDASLFDLNTSGYKKMTMQELMDMSGGAGGFGF